MRKSCIAALCGIALASSCAEGRRPRLVSAGTVALAGCLSATPSAQRYRLTLIRIYSAPAETAETVAVEDGLTEWSAVEVTGGTELLRDYLGSRIKVEGTTSIPDGTPSECRVRGGSKRGRGIVRRRQVTSHMAGRRRSRWVGSRERRSRMAVRRRSASPTWNPRASGAAHSHRNR